MSSPTRKKATAYSLAALLTLFKYEPAVAALESGLQSNDIRFSLITPRLRSQLGELPGSELSLTEPPRSVPRLAIALLNNTDLLQNPSELSTLEEQESEFSRRKAAAIARIGTGTILGTAAVIAGGALAVLGYEKNKEEDEQGVPDDERKASYYYIGALFVGGGGSGWGFSLRRRGQAELRALQAQRIVFSLDRDGSPRLAYVLQF